MATRCCSPPLSSEEVPGAVGEVHAGEGLGGAPPALVAAHVPGHGAVCTFSWAVSVGIRLND